MNKKPFPKALTALLVATCLGSAVFAVVANRNYVYGAYKNSTDQPERVYQQDAFLPAGYFNDHPVKIAVSNKFSDEEFAEIEKGITKLDGYAQGIRFEIVRTSKTTKRKDEQIIILKDTKCKHTIDNEHYYCGMTYYTQNKTKIEDYNGTIYLNNSISNELIEKTTMHEILHVFGFEHENDFRSIMFYTMGHVSTQPTQKDIENINKKFPAAEQEQ